MNLIGVVIPGERTAAVPGNRVTLDETVLMPVEIRESSHPTPSAGSGRALRSAKDGAPASLLIHSLDGKVGSPGGAPIGA
jgi:hypothetical protein